MSRRATLACLLSTRAAACGGGGTDTAALPGTISMRAIASQRNDTGYPLPAAFTTDAIAFALAST